MALARAGAALLRLHPASDRARGHAQKGRAGCRGRRSASRSSTRPARCGCGPRKTSPTSSTTSCTSTSPTTGRRRSRRTHFARRRHADVHAACCSCPSARRSTCSRAETQHGVRLYVRRVFIMDNCEELLPRWLRFVRGVVDSDDLPLNVSRELLQDSAIVRTIKKQVIRRVLDLLAELAEQRGDEYLDFWRKFGPVLKEGLHFDPEHKDKLADAAALREQQGRGAGLAGPVRRAHARRSDQHLLRDRSVDGDARAQPHARDAQAARLRSAVHDRRRRPVGGRRACATTRASR